MTIIEDGTTGCSNARVDVTNRLHTRAITLEEERSATVQGKGYVLTTSVINLTSASESLIFYIKNTETTDLQLSAVLIQAEAATGTSAAPFTKTAYINPTGGTIVSNAVPINSIVNRRIANSRVLIADIFEGVEGDTIVATGDTIAVLQKDNTFDLRPLQLILPPGIALAQSITPATGNTSMNVLFELTVYVRDGL